MKPKRQYQSHMKIVFVFLLILSIAVAGCSAKHEKTSTNSIMGSAGVAQGVPAIAMEPTYDGDYGEDPAMDEAVDVSYVRSEKMIAPSPMPYPEPMPPYPEEEGELTLDRKVIKTASMSVEVQDYEVAAIKVINLAQKYSGFVADSNSYTDKNGKKRGHVTIRIPSLHFDAALIEVGTVGEVKSQNIGGDDVTENYMDLTARLNNSRKEEARLHDILEKAEDVDDILRIERELSRVRYDIESSEGRLRYMDNHVAYSSLQVELYEPSPVVKDSGLYQAWKDAVNLFLGTIRFLVRALGLLLPLMILGAIAAVIIIWRVRKSNRRRRR